MSKTNIVDWKTITNFVIDSFVGYGVPREDAEICADVLLESDKRGIEPFIDRVGEYGRDRTQQDGTSSERRFQTGTAGELLSHWKLLLSLRNFGGKERETPFL